MRTWTLPEIFMKNIRLLSALVAVGALFAAFETHTDMVNDAYDNVGYGAVEKYDAAV